MKNQWPIWLFVVGVIVIVLFAFNYQGDNEVVSLSDIFPEEEIQALPEIEFEFVDENGQAQQTSTTQQAAATTEVATEIIASETAPKEVSKESVQMAKADIEQVASAISKGAQKDATGTAESVTTVDAGAKPNFSQVPFTIQIASYKDRSKAEFALKGVKAAGHPAYIVSRDLGEKGVWYRIYVGTFDTKTQADDFLTKLKQDNYKDSFIISPKK